VQNGQNAAGMIGYKIIRFCFVIVAIEAIFSIFRLNLEAVLGRSSSYLWLISVPLSFLVLFLTYRLRSPIGAGFSRLEERISKIPTGIWLLCLVLIGGTLRLSWLIAFPAPQRSDFKVYFELAQRLLEQHQYGSERMGFAYWPVGYSFFLYSLFRILGVHTWIPALSNFFLFLCTVFVVERIASRAIGRNAGRAAAGLLLFWPEFFTCSWLASKELLVAALLPLSLLLYFYSTAAKSRESQFAWLAGTGVVLGFAGLSQPSFVLFPSVLFLCDLLRREKLVWSFTRIACVAASMLVVILPWTIRNHRVLGVWVLVSTNGGDVFYHANNELANGGYTETAAEGFDTLNELQKSKLGFKMGENWIRHNPGRFAGLVFRKQVLFLGDDATGVYETLKRGLGQGGVRYAVLKGISNLYWLGIWTLIIAGLSLNWNRPGFLNVELCAVMLAILYLYSLHSIFESNGKYHIPLIGLFAVLAATGGRKTSSKIGTAFSNQW
jgi:4-amino-4-deoxy-L-arabinose transferase-like glycosyltransferase